MRALNQKDKQMRGYLVLPIIIALAGCAFSPPKQQSSSQLADQGSQPTDFLGCWYGEDYQPVFKQTSSWLMQRQANGAFSVAFWTWAPTGTLTKQSEAGSWTVTQKTYTTITTEIDQKKLDKSYIDIYEVVQFDGNEMVYFQPEAKATFRSKKVSCDFVPPGPQQPKSSG